MAFTAPDTDLQEAPTVNPPTAPSATGGFTAPEADRSAYLQGVDPELMAAQDPTKFEEAYQLKKERDARPFLDKAKEAVAHPLDTLGHAASGVGNFLKGLFYQVPKDVAQQAYYSATGNPAAKTKQAEAVLSAQEAGLSGEGMIDSTLGRFATAAAKLDDPNPDQTAWRKSFLRRHPEAKDKYEKLWAQQDQQDETTRDEQLDREHFARKVERLRGGMSISQGKPLESGAVADFYKGTNDLAGAPAQTMAEMVGPEALKAEGAPAIDPAAVATKGAAIDPTLLALSVAPQLPGAGYVGGKLTQGVGKALQVPMNLLEKVPGKIGKTATAVTTGVGLAETALHSPVTAAKVGVGAIAAKGLQKMGQVMESQGAEMASGAPSDLSSRAATGRLQAARGTGGLDLGAEAGRVIGNAPANAAATAVGMAPLNYALAEGDPKKFVEMEAGAGMFGTALSALHSQRPMLVEALRPHLRSEGVATMDLDSDLGKKSAAYLMSQPEEVRDRAFETMGALQGLNTESMDGRKGYSRFYVLDGPSYQAEVAKLGGTTADEGGRGFFLDGDGHAIINGDNHGDATDLAHTMGHEGGGHMAAAILRAAGSKGSATWDSMMSSVGKELLKKGKPTPEFKEFIDTYNKAFDPTGKFQRLKADDPYSLEEFLAEHAGRILAGEGNDFALPKTIFDRIEGAVGGFAAKALGIDNGIGQTSPLNRVESQAATKMLRESLAQIAQRPRDIAPEGPAADQGTPAEPAAQTSAKPAAASGSDRATVAAALKQLFGVKQAEAEAMAAAATGSTVEEMITSAAQAKSKAVAGARTTAPAAQPAPLQPAGQLAGVAPAAEPVAAPAAQLAGFGEPAAAAKPKLFVRRLPDGSFVDRAGNPIDPNTGKPPEADKPKPVLLTRLSDGSFVDPQGNPVDPKAGRAPEAPNLDRGGAAATPEAPARPVVTPEDLAGRVQAAEDAARTAEAGKKRKTPESREKATAQAVKEARIKALLDAAHETAPDEGHLQRREEFGTTSYTGRIDESIPAHRMLLDELGVSEGGRSNIDTLSANLGKPVFIKYKSAAKEGNSEAAQASGKVDRTGKQRAKEYKAESVDSRIEDAQAGDVNTGVEQTKSFYPLGFRVNPSTGSVTVTGFSPQRLLSNVGKIVDFMRSKGKDTGYSGPNDPAIHDDMQGYAQNHANGYKGDGSGPIAGETPNEHYDPYIFQDHTRFDLLNAAMGNERAKNPKRDTEGAKARAGDLQDFAAANDTLVTPEGETNPLRQWLNENGFAFTNESGETRTGTKDVLEPTIEGLRVDPELMRDISTEAPESETSLRPTGVADPSAMTAQGIPKARNVAAGFMPGQGAEKGQLSEFGGDRDKPSIESKVPQTDELGFYSRLRQHVDEADFGTSKPKAAQHWLGVIEKWAKGASTPTLGVQSRGIARDELEWSGVKEWLKSQGSTPIKKADVLAFIDGNGVKVSEVQKGSGNAEGDAYWMDDEVQDLSYAFEDDHNGAWEINAWPNEEGGESKSLAAIFQPKNEKSYKIKNEGGEFVLYSGDGRNYSEEIGSFKTRQEAEDALNEEREAEDSADPVFEIHDSSGGSSYLVDTAKTFEEAVRKAREIASKRLRELNEEAGGEDAGDTQFSGYKLDGGTNYKEILLTLPERDRIEYTNENVVPIPANESQPDPSLFWNFRAPGQQFQVPKSKFKTLEEAKAYVIREKQPEAPADKNFTDSHWEEPNVVAHFRQQDFERDSYGLTEIRAVEKKIVEAVGAKSASSLGSGAPEVAVRKGVITPLEAAQYSHFKNFTSGVDQAGATEKVRHVDEIQSDWHQKGRERGYKSELKSDIDTSEWTATKKPVNTLPWQPPAQEGDFYWEIADADGRRISGVGREQASTPEEAVKRAAQLQADQAKQQAIPDAPFKKSWSQLAFKRALKLAVEDGMDRMSWSTGDQNIEHYKNALVAEVNNITWTHPPAKDFKIVTLDTNSSGMLRFNVAPDGTISESGGGHVATQFEGKKLGDVIGNDNAKKILDPGEGQMDGEGMQVGGEGMRTFYDEILPQFASKYVSKWGSKVEDVTLPNGDTVHSVKITPEMRAAVEQGQPMFMPGKGSDKPAGDLSNFGDEESEYADLYHGTDQRYAERMTKDGFTGQKGVSAQSGRKGMLHLTTTPENAKWYADQHENPAIVKVRVPKKDLVVDPDDGVSENIHDELNLPHSLPGNLATTAVLSADSFTPHKSGEGDLMPGKDGDLSKFGDEPSIESKVEWAQPKRAKAAGDVVVNVKTSAFDEAFQKDHGFYIDKDGNGEIKGRRDRFKEFLKEGKAIEMPEVVITKEGTAAFVNGRHRFSVMRDAGVESVPMSMDETSALRAQTLGMTAEGKFMPGSNLQSGLDNIRKEWESRGIDSFASIKGRDITLSQIEVPKGERGEGKGTAAMQELLDFAEENGLRVLLTPDVSYGASSKDRLKRFYRGLGFVENKGRNKDFRTRESMIWRPSNYEKNGQLGSFMPSDETGRGEFEVKEKKPLDERRARLMADMQGQAKWLTDRAKEKGFDSVDDLMTEDFDGYNDLAKQWREDHPRFNAAGEQLFMPGKMEGATPEEREANFSKWTGDAPVIRVGDSLHDVEPGQPVVIEGFHGTTHDFTAVDTSKANIENDWGKGFYVTNTPEDVENNYAGEGPDLTQRIEKRAEQIHSELGFADATISDLAEFKGESDAKEWWDSMTAQEQDSVRDEFQKANTITMEEARARAKEELTTHGGSTMKVFVKLENPLKLGEGSGKEGYWDAETPMDEETGDPDGEPTGKLVDFIEALREVSRDYDEADIDSADDLNQLIWDGGAKPSDALAAAKKALQYATDPETGDSATSEILRAAVEQMGYDGIIDETVNDKFGSNKATGKAMTGMDDYTFHVIAFRPESVKSATGNRGTFDGSNPDMTMMPGNSARRTWFMRNGKRVYHHRGEAGQFAEKPALAKLGVSAISQKKDDNAKAQLETFK